MSLLYAFALVFYLNRLNPCLSGSYSNFVQGRYRLSECDEMKA